MEHFTPIASSVGGALIGLSAGVLLLLKGRIAGVSGILGGLLSPRRGDAGWRVAFVLGLVGGALAYTAFNPGAVANTTGRPVWAVVAAGLLVGYGTRLGNGCTSGHGVCGISRLSRRSLAATATFMLTAGVTVFLFNHALGATS